MTEYLDSLGHFILSRYAAPGDTLTRMERLPAYAVTSDGGDFEAWKTGASAPVSAARAETIEDLHQERANGQVRRRIRILSAALTDYERYSIEFGYLQNVEAGEEVRVLRHGEHPIPQLLDFDYWLINDRDLARMHYDADGQFLGAESAPRLVREARREISACWDVAEPVTAWWHRHPELHRQLTR
ncbi:hypothetical protein Ae168Ps1_6241 [Pseudonocardia sp. Ae168_Ps1]|uniref:DUF6879 family protein n=1 Tax=unclassified Pseudonocardia TaxID=2619320 RepID=UPI00095CC345|nr:MULTISPECIES: DUF6879 family protein [unclassified Pseudonocardia]OLL70494.1 hypothetical protein Ae168Ps1_6241 [Pseudonocardia sp. Ae168_Ps1]OLL71613.1 hypothetical protein Ae263Ps1_6101 [Pseudonocardia sp. Ae263_Ps1]